MNLADWVDAVSDDSEVPLLKMEGYDDCIIGVVRRFNESFILYDKSKVLRRLCADGMTFEEAEEWYEFNMVGAWLGEGTVAFLERPEDA